MRNAQKWSTSENFSQVRLTKEALIEFLKTIKLPDEKVEVKVGDVIFEGIEELIAHSESLTFPLEVEIGKLSIYFDLNFRNRVSGPPEDHIRVASVAKEIEKHRNPLSMLEGFWGYGLLAVTFSVIILLASSFVMRLLVGKLTDVQFSVLSLGSISLAIFLAIRAQNLCHNRFYRMGAGSFIGRYGDKIAPSVASSLITAGVIWVFSNWDKVKTLLGFMPSHP